MTQLTRPTLGLVIHVRIHDETLTRQNSMGVLK
jgi:hypothetical protein